MLDSSGQHPGRKNKIAPRQTKFGTVYERGVLMVLAE
ncbi:hypothetical protein ACVJGD_000735 [Bradyrhizobium sp. USDA 10063]